MINTTEDFANLTNLLSVYSEAQTQLATLQAEINQSNLDTVSEHLQAYAKLQSAINDSAEAIKILAERNPQWFAEAKTVKTPFGEVASRSVTKHAAADDALSIALIERAAEQAEKRDNIEQAQLLRSFLRVEKSLNYEALSNADLDLLQKLRISRETDQSITVKEAKVNLGNAVKTVTKAAKKKTEVPA